MARSKVLPRLKKAIEKYEFPYTKREVAFYKRFKGEFKPKKIENINNLLDVLSKRSKTDRALDSLFYNIISLLEPRQCYKSHCQYHGGPYMYCMCGKELNPSKCKDNRDFLKRQKLKLKEKDLSVHS